MGGQLRAGSRRPSLSLTRSMRSTCGLRPRRGAGRVGACARARADGGVQTRGAGSAPRRRLAGARSRPAHHCLPLPPTRAHARKQASTQARTHTNMHAVARALARPRPHLLQREELAAGHQLLGPLALPDDAPDHEGVVVGVGHADDALGQEGGHHDGVVLRAKAGLMRPGGGVALRGVEGRRGGPGREGGRGQARAAAAGGEACAAAGGAFRRDRFGRLQRPAAPAPSRAPVAFQRAPAATPAGCSCCCHCSCRCCCCWRCRCRLPAPRARPGNRRARTPSRAPGLVPDVLVGQVAKLAVRGPGGKGRGRGRGRRRRDWRVAQARAHALAPGAAARRARAGSPPRGARARAAAAPSELT